MIVKFRWEGVKGEMVEGGGFEPPKGRRPPGLQPGPFGRSGIPPLFSTANYNTSSRYREHNYGWDEGRGGRQVGILAIGELAIGASVIGELGIGDERCCDNTTQSLSVQVTMA